MLEEDEVEGVGEGVEVAEEEVGGEEEGGSLNDEQG